MVRRSLAAAAVLVSGCWSVTAGAEERVWEIRGGFLALKPDDPQTAIFEFADGRRAEVPLAALSAGSREAVRRLAEGSQPAPAEGTDAVLPEELVQAPETCAKAADVADLCRLVAAASGAAPAARAAIDAMREAWDAKAVRGEVRHDRQWVSAEAAAASGRKAEELIRQAAEMVRLGNPKLAREKLEEASQADPASGRADFLIGMAYLVGGRPDVEKAEAAFARVLRRQPHHAVAWHNLAVCELQRRRYQAAVDVIRTAAIQPANPQALAANLALIIRLAGDRRQRVPSKSVEEVTELYGRVIADHGLQRPENVTVPVILGPDGMPTTATDPLELARLASLDARPAPQRAVGGIVVAEGVVAVPAEAVGGFEPARLMIVAGGRSIVADRKLATIADGTITLLECTGLDMAPLVLAAACPGEKAELLVVVPRPTSAPSAAEPLRSSVVAAVSGGERRRFVHDADSATGPVTAAIMDAAGRLVGLAGPQPTRRPAGGGGLSVGVPVEELWAALDLRPVDPEPDEKADPVPWEEVAGRVAGATVEVFTP